MCSNIFTSKDKNKMFCCISCYHNHMKKTAQNNPLIKRICINPSCMVDFSVKIKSNKKKFCSRSCAAQVNNVAFPKRDKVHSCKKCGVKVKSGRSYCDKDFASLYEERRNVRIQAWIKGEWNGCQKNNSLMSQTVSNYLLKQANYACSGCGFNTPHPVDGSTILEIDHINGDGTDHSPSNVRVLCPNCHALTPTYRGRNVGNGKRTIHYIRVTR